MSSTTTSYQRPAESPFNSLSELDSDSDWLDIASGRESDTDDSLDPVESTSASLSRRSSFSIGSSRDGEVDAWEGLVEDISEGTNSLGINQNPSSVQANEAENSVDEEVDSVEEQRVLDGLEQSLISTLSASRSSSLSSTVHSSLRDLRLSFPDPLTSSCEESNDNHDSTSPVPAASRPVEEPCKGEITIPSAQVTALGDQGVPSTPLVPHGDERRVTPGCKDVLSDIILYGSPTPLRWQFVDNLLMKVAEGGGRALPFGERVNDEIKRVTLCSKITEHSDVILVQDRTDGFSLPSSELSPGRPSLAIVFLPCKPPVYGFRHTSYLPVVAASETKDVHDLTTLLQAQITWPQSQIPDHRVIRLHDNDQLFINQVHDLDPYRTYRALRYLIKKPARRGMQAVTIFALLSLIIGFSVNTVMRMHNREVASPAAVPYTTSTKALATDSVTNSTALAVRITSDLFVVPPSLSIVPPAHERGSTTPESSTQTSVITRTNAVSIIPSSLKALSEKAKSSKDLILRSAPTTTEVVSPREAPVASTSGAHSEQETSAISVRLVGSLSEIVEVTVRALIEVIHHDLNDLIMAIDELRAAIHRQTRMVVEQSKSTVTMVREQFQYRNDRAKGKARELREKGVRFMSYAGDAFVGRTRIAQKRAQSLKDGVASSHIWAVYSKAHGEWSEALARKGRRKLGRRRRGVDGIRRTCN
ncbi:hypothetical protein E1B28_011228 [Marasmius oreades]|uniref:Uncharacterized protein n=1 Tax=Marasmius oreades TaxID=181124 RepID=A0A9P7RUP9_9AGAR|nr:uncharacterized protein E1B28_011228 [Marasmius oreades]KAG7089556.1 hypothetical protein E1B28_011228 [Marasmius oreades]